MQAWPLPRRAAAVQLRLSHRGRASVARCAVRSRDVAAAALGAAARSQPRPALAFMQNGASMNATIESETGERESGPSGIESDVRGLAQPEELSVRVGRLE